MSESIGTNKKDSAGPFPGIAETVLHSYDIVPARIEYVAHSENVAFHVVPTEGDAEYVLRVHYPSSDLFPSEWRRREMIESEVEWLAALRTDTDLIVPQPVANKDGSWVTQVAGEQFPETLNCTLLVWIEGEFLNKRPTPGQARKIGRLIAGIHEHGELWKRPRGFVRPEHSFQVMEDDMARLKEAAAQGAISAPDLLVLEKAVECLYETTQMLGFKSDTWGLIHTDVHPGNTLLTPHGMGLIDFSSCAFGHFAFDIATPLLHNGSARDGAVARALLEGYRSIRALPPEPEITISAFIGAQIIDGLACSFSRPDRHEKMQRVLLPYAVKYCEDFLAGKIALFEE
jgi:Ser/Thr protein kinase RdoA (MazF antagonist)